jgi:hypothetical protein
MQEGGEAAHAMAAPRDRNEEQAERGQAARRNQGHETAALRRAAAFRRNRSSVPGNGWRSGP